MQIIETVDILGKKVSELPGIEGAIPSNYKIIVADPLTGAMAQADKAQVLAFTGGGTSSDTTPGEASIISPFF